jgi:hypothetical protein
MRGADGEGAGVVSRGVSIEASVVGATSAAAPGRGAMRADCGLAGEVAAMRIRRRGRCRRGLRIQIGRLVTRDRPEWPKAQADLRPTTPQRMRALDGVAPRNTPDLAAIRGAPTPAAWSPRRAALLRRLLRFLLRQRAGLRRP